ncbi:hypothetical protein L3X38_010108 [Prunus dulcis]|uniref:Uncharacterized protein n=1 Tax=Prunus dulcis TaxID=3755 RepID=A0AAD4ZEG4_PRUDU|nr:hypothetical protein L3X38_010108 [Prunus dulcis]
MLSFATTIDNIRQRLEQRHDVLTLLSKTTFLDIDRSIYPEKVNEVAWTYTTTIDTLEEMGKYNWARGVLDYMYFGLEQAKKNKKDKKKQPSVSGCLILIPYWLCQRSNLLTPIPGREQMTPAAVKWSLQELSAKLHHLENNQIKIKSTKAQEPDDDSEEENEEEDAAAEEVNEEHDDAAEEVNEEHGDADEEENEEEDAEMNEEHDDAAEHQVQQHHQLQEGHQQHHQQYRNSTLFEEIVGSVPEYKEDEIQLTKEYMIAINNAAEYWTKKGEHQKIHDAIASCIKRIN